MRFNSLEYGVFFGVILVLYYLISPRFRTHVLFAASVIFYMSWKAEYIILIMGTLSLCYMCIRQMTRHEARKTQWLILCLVFSLTPLIYFKYSNFLISNYFSLLDNLFDLDSSGKKLEIILPLGISFYTFQLLSYAIDVYREEAPLEKYPVFLTYILFFPQLIAGPIVRSHILIPQLKSGSLEADSTQFEKGFALILFGLFKKVVIADYLASVIDSYFVDVFSIPSTGFDCIMLLYAFSFQIYFDFGGYTDIARGSAKMLGIELPINFNYPYVARNLREFWRRWHITLSTWLRDYLYISLGGSRTNKQRLYTNIFITMVLGGLWHGASWTFVVWGILHGVALIVTRMYQEPGAIRQPASSAKGTSFIRNCIAVFLTYNAVCLGWLFFRAPSLAFAQAYLTRIGQFGSGCLESRLPPLFTPLVICLFCGQWPIYALKDKMALPKHRLARAALFTVSVILIMVLSQKTSTFIYFQF